MTTSRNRVKTARCLFRRRVVICSRYTCSPVRIQPTTILYPLVSALLGGALCIALFAHILPPTNTAWIFNDGWDTAQHQLGWEFYRKTDWSIPVGINRALGYPVGSSLHLTDSIPLVGIPLKLIERFLPGEFQYLGLWILFSCVLQGFAGYYLVRLFLKSPALAVIGSQFFVLSPILLFRVAGHASLTAHWLILVALYLYFVPHDRLAPWKWLALLSLSVLVHPYLFFMVTAVMAADSIKMMRFTRESFVRLISFLFLQVLGVGTVAWMAGLFHVGKSSAKGFGVYSMNLDAFINPYWWGGWSYLLPAYNTTRYQYEGFAYLGIGVLTLLLLAILIRCASPASLLATLRRHWSLLVICTLLTVLSVTNSVYFHERLILTLPLPEVLRPFFEVVRSSGRMIWPVYYVLILFALTSVREMKKGFAVFVLSLMLLLQIADLYPGLKGFSDQFSPAPIENRLTSEMWQKFENRYAHITFVGGYREPETEDFETSRYLPIARFAEQNGMTINDGYFARALKGQYSYLVQERVLLEAGERNIETLYIFKDTPKEIPFFVQSSDFIGVVDGYYLVAPDFYR